MIVVNWEWFLQQLGNLPADELVFGVHGLLYYAVPKLCLCMCLCVHV